ncbi:glyoxalase [Virgisporangium aliadipatigenens]|uniref:Glyoxalase n=1 Tax=Virgisporangium aliadipatigenens TaxID=741659 RepID=A0A8J3YU01_9ACTN|nr:VOC family protein [Virgisporangium aliadipatigenens]GIJ50467.1 glyoxalase [Virgisporangium aliadipatigenens]
MSTVAWFQIGAEDVDAAERFYGGLFGWTFKADPDAERPYRIAPPAGPGTIGGAVTATQGKRSSYAVFAVLVDDVADTVRRAEEAGAKVVQPPHTTPAGLTHAHLLDPEGSEFAVFSQPKS